MGTPRRKAWPVGQVVKTAASHAVNIGSNPVRVTTSKQAADHSLPRSAKAHSLRCFSSSLFKRFAGLKSEIKALDKAQKRQYNTGCSPVRPDDIVGAD